MQPAPSILIVDDDALLRAFAREVLGADGFSCQEAEDGCVAIARLAQQSFDAVLIDLIMPNKEGIETIQHIAAAWPDLRILAMSAGARNIPAAPILSAASVLGAHAVLRKPLVAERLTEAVRNLLAPAPSTGAWLAAPRPGHARGKNSS